MGRGTNEHMVLRRGVTGEEFRTWSVGSEAVGRVCGAGWVT